MAITIVNSKQGTGTSLTITSATTGNILVAFISQTVSVVAPPTLTGWTVNGTNCTFGATSQDGGYVAIKTAAGGETSIAPTAGTGGTITGIAYYELSGATTTFDSGSSFPVATNTTATMATLASTAFSTTNTGSIILCCVLTDAASGTVTAWTSTVLTNIATTTTAAIGGSLIPGTTETSITPTANWTTNRHAGMVAIALTPPSTGSTAGLLPVL